MRHFSKVAIIYRVKMSVIVGQLLDRSGIVILHLVIRFKFVYTRENFFLKCQSVDQLRNINIAEKGNSRNFNWIGFVICDFPDLKMKLWE